MSQIPRLELAGLVSKMRVSSLRCGWKIIQQSQLQD